MDEMFFGFVCLVYFCRLSPLPLAWLLDRWLGDPAWLPHPVVGFGKLIAWGEKSMNVGSARVWKGGLVSAVLIAGVYLFQGDRRVFHRIDGSDKDPADILLPGRNDVDT